VIEIIYSYKPVRVTDNKQTEMNILLAITLYVTEFACNWGCVSLYGTVLCSGHDGHSSRRGLGMFSGDNCDNCNPHCPPSSTI